MGEYAILSRGEQHFIFDTDADGQPTGKALGAYKGTEEAEQAVKTLRSEQNSGIAIASPITAGFKLIHDDQLWVAYYSNAIKDLEGEIFPMAETDRYIEMVKSGKWPMPELWHKHRIGSKHGQAEWIGRIGVLTVAIGSFDNNSIAESFKAYYRKNKQRLSHGFFFDARKRRNGVYGPYATFEITTLDPGEEANPFTTFEVKDSDMAFTAQDIKELERLLGEADAKTFITGSVEASNKLVDANLAFKAMTGAAKPDDEEDADGKKKPTFPPEKKALDTVDSKALDTRLDGLETAIKGAFGVFATEVGKVVTPINATIAQQQTQINALVAGLKQLTGVLQREFAMQPPAMNNPATAGQPPADPNLAAYQQMMGQQWAGQPQGSKEQTMPYGFFGEVLNSMGGNKAAQPPAFEFPGVPPIPQMPPPQQAPPMPPQQGYPQPQQPMQPQNYLMDQFGVPQAPPQAGMGQGFPRFPTSNGQ